MILVNSKHKTDSIKTQCRLPMFCISNLSLEDCTIPGIKERLHIVKFDKIKNNFISDPYTHWFKKDEVNFMNFFFLLIHIILFIFSFKDGVFSTSWVPLDEIVNPPRSFCSCRQESYSLPCLVNCIPAHELGINEQNVLRSDMNKLRLEGIDQLTIERFEECKEQLELIKLSDKQFDKAIQNLNTQLVLPEVLAQVVLVRENNAVSTDLDGHDSNHDHSDLGICNVPNLVGLAKVVVDSSQAISGYQPIPNNAVITELDGHDSNHVHLDSGICSVTDQVGFAKVVVVSSQPISGFQPSPNIAVITDLDVLDSNHEHSDSGICNITNPDVLAKEVVVRLGVNSGYQDKDIQRSAVKKRLRDNDTTIGDEESHEYRSSQIARINELITNDELTKLIKRLEAPHAQSETSSPHDSYSCVGK